MFHVLCNILPQDLDRGDKHHETSSQKQTDKIQHQEKAQNGEKGPKQQLNHGTNVLEEKTKTLINSKTPGPILTKINFKRFFFYFWLLL